MKIRDAMTTMNEMIDPDTNLGEAVRRMREIGTDFLAVGVDDRLVGTITEQDIVARTARAEIDPNTFRIREAMSKELVYCFDDQETSEAAALMANKNLGRVPVLNNAKRFVGVLSREASS